METGELELQLQDVYSHEMVSPKVQIRASGCGLELLTDGFGTYTMEPGAGSPVYLEFRNGIPFLVVWADITQEEPTHSISLEGASEKFRIN